ncbi:unnamed protein product, partial [Phaeothamnion confervicola]
QEGSRGEGEKREEDLIGVRHHRGGDERQPRLNCRLEGRLFCHWPVVGMLWRRERRLRRLDGKEKGLRRSRLGHASASRRVLGLALSTAGHLHRASVGRTRGILRPPAPARWLLLELPTVQVDENVSLTSTPKAFGRPWRCWPRSTTPPGVG